MNFKLWKVRRCVNLEAWHIEMVMVGSSASVAFAIGASMALPEFFCSVITKC